MADTRPDHVAYDKGYDAYKAGAVLLHNPYSGFWLREAWDRGWRAAERVTQAIRRGRHEPEPTGTLRLIEEPL